MRSFELSLKNFKSDCPMRVSRPSIFKPANTAWIIQTMIDGMTPTTLWMVDRLAFCQPIIRRQWRDPMEWQMGLWNLSGVLSWNGMPCFQDDAGSFIDWGMATWFSWWRSWMGWSSTNLPKFEIWSPIANRTLQRPESYDGSFELVDVYCPTNCLASYQRWRYDRPIFGWSGKWLPMDPYPVRDPRARCSPCRLSLGMVKPATNVGRKDGSSANDGTRTGATCSSFCDTFDF